MARKKKAAVNGQSTAKLSPKGDDSWTPEEQAILEDGLKKYPSDSRVNYCCLIANDIPNKNMIEVALRIKWMTDNKKGYFAGPSPPAVETNKVEIEQLVEHNYQILQLIKAKINGVYGEPQKVDNKSLFFEAYHNIRKLKERAIEMPGGEKLMDEFMGTLDEKNLFSIFPVIGR